MTLRLFICLPSIRLLLFSSDNTMFFNRPIYPFLLFSPVPECVETLSAVAEGEGGRSEMREMSEMLWSSSLSLQCSSAHLGLERTSAPALTSIHSSSAARARPNSVTSQKCQKCLDAKITADMVSVNYHLIDRARSMWTPFHHTHTCLLNAPFHIQFSFAVNNKLHSFRKVVC